MTVKYVNAAYEFSPYSSGRHLTLLALCDSTNDDGMVWLSVATLARKARMCERMARYHLRELEADGVLEDLGRHPDPTYKGVTVYRVRIDTMKAMAAKVQPPAADEAEAEPVARQPRQPVAPGNNCPPAIQRTPGGQSTTPQGGNPLPPIPSQSIRDPGDARVARAHEPPPPGPDDQVEDGEARRAGNRRRFVRLLRELVVASERDIEVDEWTGIGRQAGVTGFDELLAAVRWCVLTGRREGLKVRWPSDVVHLTVRCGGWLRAKRDQVAHQSEITDAEPAETGGEATP